MTDEEIIETLGNIIHEKLDLCKDRDARIAIGRPLINVLSALRARGAEREPEPDLKGTYLSIRFEGEPDEDGCVAATVYEAPGVYSFDAIEPEYIELLQKAESAEEVQEILSELIGD